MLITDMPTRYNSSIYADEPAQGIDATCVAVLRAAGAVVLGECYEQGLDWIPMLVK